MNLNAYNLESTRAPRRPVPWWIYGVAILLGGLLIWAAVLLLSAKSRPEPEPVVEEVPAVVAAPRPPAPAAQRPPATGAPTRKTDDPALPGILQTARQLLQQEKYLEAREQALNVWENANTPTLKSQAETILNQTANELILTPRPMPEKIDYTVQSGDSLERIARRHGTTVQLLMESNRLTSDTIRIGDRLRVFTGKFRIEVSKSNNDLVLYMNDRFLKRYPVGTGEYNKTPVGDFKITDRIAQPTWWRPDGRAIPYGHEDNLLGTHWLAINVKGYGLHGTWEPESIGHQLSAGCVRMLNDDIKELFNLLPVGTPVTIRD